MHRDANDPNHLQFTHYRQLNQSYSIRYRIQSAGKSSFLDLCEQFSTILKYAPRLFTITTNSNSYHFNTELLKDASSVIEQNLRKDPNNLQFHIDINDKKNVMQKFEKLFMGEKVIFAENELSVSRKITSALKIIRCPNYMKPESLHTSSNYGYNSGSSIESGVIINKANLPIFFQNGLSKSFTISTNLKKYNCTIIGVMSSKVIRELVEKDSSLNTFEYDFEDEFNEFEDVCNFFNFKPLQITTTNMTYLQKIAEDLQIEYVLEEIKKFIEKYQDAIQTINDKQFLIDTIDELFEWLYHIKEFTIERVKESIVESFWSETEEDVQELAAFILQVIKNDIQYHQDILELLIQLDQSANETNSLHLLLLFIINYLLLSFVKNNSYCSFVYLLYKNGRIEIKEIIDIIISNNKTLLKQPDIFISSKKNKKSNVSEAILWFFPELYHNEIISRRKLFENLNPEYQPFILFYFPSNVDKYKRMRDSGEPDDEITKALRRDDVDTLQSIVSKRETDFSNEKVPFNMFESFIDNGCTNYLNYSAAYGSTKCFKYLLLNHAEINDTTFDYAVFGGNNEIIRIAFQSSEKLSELNANKTSKKSSHNRMRNLNSISASIIKHQNNLFDWILEQKYTSKGITGNDLSEILFSSISNGNAHSIIECIDKGLDMNSLSNSFCLSAIESACKNGFYRLTQLLFIFIKKSSLDVCSSRIASELCENAALFGNLSLFKYVVEYLNTEKKRFENSIVASISRNHFSIIKYIVETLDGQFSNESIGEFLYVSINKGKVDIFKYLIGQFSIIPSQTVLITSCQFGNFEIVKIIVDLIIKNNNKYDFTDAFVQSALIGSEEICRYFVEKKANLNFNVIEKKIFRFTSKNENIVFLLIGIADPEVKTVFLNTCLNEAIRNGNKKLAEYLINNNVNIDEALFEAAAYGNIEIVDMILKRNSQPFYINQISELGTALNIAVKSNSYSVVKRLLSIPGIDPSLYEQRNATPLVTAIINYNLKMVNAILDFYGDEIQLQLWQINKALEIVLQDQFTKCIKNNDQLKSFLLNEILNTNRNEFINVENQYMDDFDENDVNPYFAYDDVDDDDDDDEDDDDDDVDINALENSKNALLGEEEEEKNENSANKSKNHDKENTILNVMSRILQIKNININCHIDNFTLLHYACEKNEISLVKMLLNYEGCDVNSYAPFDGSTPLMVAIKNENFDIAELLLNLPKTNVNCSDYRKETALTIAVYHGNERIIDLIVKNDKFNPIISRLDYAFFIASDQIASQLYLVKDLDVNYISVVYQAQKVRRKRNPIEMICLNETTLTRAVAQKDIEKIKLITSHSSFDKVKSQLKTAIFLSAKMNNVEIFKKLIFLRDNDVNCIGKNNESLLYWAVFNQSEEIVAEILRNDHFDSRKSDILESFILSFTECKKSDPNDDGLTASISIMNKIFTFDNENDHLIDLNRCLQNGKSFFTSISDKFYNADEIIDFFIEKGANPNLPDSFGVYPLQYGLQSANAIYVGALINSTKIDFSTRIGELEMTYLHLAAASKSETNLLEILSQNAIDVNSIDKNGDTPLIYAVRALKDKNVVDLFRNDNLDYAHKNNDGDDALNIAKKNSSQKSRTTRVRPMNSRNAGNADENQGDEKSNYLAQLLITIKY